MYAKGKWKVICDVCGFEFLNTEVRKRWDNLIVCDKDFETDHPQKYLRVRADGLPVPLIRQPPEDVFVQTCSIWTATARADFGTADCMTADNNTSIELLIQLFSPDTRAVAQIATTGYAITGVI